jgi:hypothetical protein
VRTRWLALICASWCSACLSKGPVRQLPENFGHGYSEERGPDCVVYGEMLTLRGRILVRPLGKHRSDLVFLRVSAREKWLVSYNSPDILDDLDGKRVEVTGRACQPQGAAYGPVDHFMIATLARLGQRSS